MKSKNSDKVSKKRKLTPLGHVVVGGSHGILLHTISFLLLCFVPMSSSLGVIYGLYFFGYLVLCFAFIAAYIIEMGDMSVSWAELAVWSMLPIPVFIWWVYKHMFEDYEI